MPEEVVIVVEVMGNAVRTEILRALSQSPMTGRELARSIDVGHSTVQRYLTRLEEQGLVTSETNTPAGRRQGQRVVWASNRERIAELGRQWVAYASAEAPTGPDDVPVVDDGD